HPAFESAGVIMLQVEIPLPAVQRAVDEARRRQIQVILNPAPAQPLDAALLRQVDFIVPNRSELTLLTGEAEVEAGVRALLAAGVKQVVVTLGEAGALVWDESGATPIAPHAVKAVDTTAAGDAFVGAFAVALSQGRSPVEAARWGNAAGAIAVTRAGAQPSLPSRAEVEALLARA
ncbi:MAG: PfkB family carbohydrate kinase, partial [Caldilineaceae bacterium]